MKKKLSILLCIFIAINLSAQDVKPTKNIILMIPDGTSLSVLSASRWLKAYRGEEPSLNVDPYICGTVTTFSSNAPIGDSAPTTSCYMTGIPEQASNISMYPIVDPANDLVKLNPDSTYQPLATIMEAMQREQGKSAGLVVTCEFPHATPADCSSHYYNRNDYASIAPQMAFNNLNVMFGGGTDFVTDVMKKHFTDNGTTYFENNKDGLLNFSGEKIWALFDKRELPYDLDRDTTKIPSLAQMTAKALEVLNKNEKGFFLLVEGSKVDWAAHANDAAGMMSEFMAFDRAVKAAIDFAKKDGNTTVVILPDHGNSGFAIGRNGLNKTYTKLTLSDLFETVSKFKHTAEGLEKILLATKPDNFKQIFKENTAIDLTDDELKSLLSSKNYNAVDYTKAGTGENLTAHIVNILKSHTPFGFATNGHTGEEVFLAVYNPNNEVPVGNRRNTELHKYLHKVSGLKKPMNVYTNELFSKYTDVFAGYKCTVDTTNSKNVKLIVKNKKKTIEISAFSSVALLNGMPYDLGSVAVFVDKNKMFYVPKNLGDKLK